jgi:hypothetical protein
MSDFGVSCTLFACCPLFLAADVCGVRRPVRNLAMEKRNRSTSALLLAVSILSSCVVDVQGYFKGDPVSSVRAFAQPASV